MNYLVTYYVKINIFYSINNSPNIVSHWEKYVRNLGNIFSIKEVSGIIRSMYPTRLIRIESIQELDETSVPEIKVMHTQDKVNEFLNQISLKE